MLDGVNVAMIAFFAMTWMSAGAIIVDVVNVSILIRNFLKTSVSTHCGAQDEQHNIIGTVLAQLDHLSKVMNTGNILIFYRVVLLELNTFLNLITILAA